MWAYVVSLTGLVSCQAVPVEYMWLQLDFLSHWCVQRRYNWRIYGYEI